MTAQKASPAARLAGWAAVLAAVLLTGAVILHLAGRRERPARPADDRALAASGPVDRKETVRHREYLEGRTSAEVLADRYFLGPDGLRHLEGGVEVTEYGPDGAVISRISADEILYDKDRSFFRISGRARISVEDVVLEGPHFEYDQAGGVFRTGPGGAFSSERMSGTAAGISYSRGPEEVLLSGGFRVVVGAGDPGPGVSRLTGEHLRFLRVPGRGEAAGKVRFAHGRVVGAAESLTFALDAGGRSFRSMDLEGKPSMTLDGTAEGGDGGLTLQADAISASFSADDGRIETLDARGEAGLSLVSRAGRRALLTAGRAEIRLDGAGEVQRWAASEGFRMDYAGGPERDWTLEGADVEGDGGLRSLRAEAGAGREAALESGRFRVAAAALELADEGDDVKAEGGLEGHFKPRSDAPVGFFSSEAPVLVSARRMERSGSSGRTRFEGTARIWQGDRRIEAEDLSVDEGTGEVRAEGKAEARFPHGPGSGEDGGTVEAGGEAISYSPPDRLLVLRGKGYVRMRGAALAAEEIAGLLGEGGQGLETLTARTGVVVSRDRYEGRGGEARYEAAADRIELVGSPVLVDRDGRVSRGSKLTFDLADDRIRLENEGQGRSTTVIKS
jgi:lipopolysaccharide export system protein LptA